MLELKVFIASSGELSEEREVLKTFINTESDFYHDFGLYIKPIMWELESKKFAEGRKQEEYNELLRNCDIAIFMFGTKVGNYTKEEFNVAVKNKRKNNIPKYIFTYFKEGKISSGKLSKEDIVNLRAVFDFKKQIANNHKQVYDFFYNIDDLRLKIGREINKIVLPLIVDKKNTIQIGKSQEFIDLYNSIEPAFQTIYKNTIIDSAINQLYLLRRYNIKPKLSQLSEEEFYVLCNTIIDSTQRGSEIKALSMMLKCEWNNSNHEKSFWKSNADAVSRQAMLERIFIVKRDEAHRIKNIPQILQHIENDSEYLKPYVVEKEYLQENNPELLKRAQEGFILINDQTNRVALLDNDPQSGMRGTPIFDNEELNNLENVFNDIKNIAVPLNEYLKEIKLSHYKKEMFSVFVTTECNLNCDYCFTNKYSDNHQNQTIDFDFVKKGIDDYFATDYLRHIRFFGAGEPTVKLELIKKICSYAVDKGGEAVTFEIQTNGAFNDNTAYWLSQNIDVIWISCDGTPEMQDLHRLCLDKTKKSSQLIEKNIKILKKSKKCFVGIRATITNENINRQLEMIDYFYSLGITEIWVDPLFPSVAETIEKVDFDNMHFAKKFLEASRYANDKGIFYGSIMTCNFGDSVTKHCRACIPVPHLTTDGYVSACDMALFGEDKNHMSDFIYGRWNSNTKEIEYDQAKIKKLQSRSTENMNHCNDCPSKDHCGGYCLGEVLNETKDLFGRKKGVCEAIKYLDKNMENRLRNYKHTHP